MLSCVLPALNQEYQGHQSRQQGRRLPHVGHGRWVNTGRATSRACRRTARRCHKVTVDATVDFDCHRRRCSRWIRLADIGTAGLVVVAAREKFTIAEVVAIALDADGDIGRVHEGRTGRLSLDLGTSLGTGSGGRGHGHGGRRGKARRLSTGSTIGKNTVAVIETGRDATVAFAKTKVQDVDQRVGCEWCAWRER